MKRGIMTIALVAMLVAAAAVGAPLEKPIINNEIQQKSVMMSPVGSRINLVDEGFEDGVPPFGWTIMTTGNSYTWAQSTNANTGIASAFVQYGPGGAWQDEWLVTPALDASALTSITLEFAENESYWADWGLEHSILVSTTVPDDPAAFTEALVMTPANHTISGWGMVTLALNEYAGMDNIYVAFRYQGDYADDWYVDDVRIFEPYAHDVQVSGLTPSGDTVWPGTEFYPQVMVENVGGNTETFDVSLTITLDGAVISEEMITVIDLPSGGSANLEFPPFTTMAGAYVLTAMTLLAEDLDPSNDTGAGMVNCYDQERTPFGILYTEWGCPPCVAANQAADAWYPTQGNDVALMRVHVYWPAGDDPMYWANEEDNLHLLQMPPFTVNGVPWLVLDNWLDGYGEDWSSWDEAFPLLFGMSSDTPAPLAVDLGYNADSGNVEVMVNVVNAMGSADYRLFVGVTEDGIELQGPNGEPVHNQAFRQLYPGVEGMAISTDQGMGVYEVPVALDESWVFENLRAVAWVQEYPGGPVLNCGTVFMSEGVVSIDDDYVNDEVEDNNTPALVTMVKGAHPNPFNPMTTVKFSVARTQHVSLAVFNMSGQRVATLADGTYEAGEHPVQWNGTDASGRGVSSGTYIVHMQSEDGVSASKIMLVR